WAVVSRSDQHGSLRCRPPAHSRHRSHHPVAVGARVTARSGRGVVPARRDRDGQPAMGSRSGSPVHGRTAESESGKVIEVRGGRCEGFALIAVLTAMLLMSALGAALILLSWSERLMAAAYRTSV